MFAAKYNKLGSLEGYTLNSYEQAQIRQLENEIEDLREEKECKNQLLQSLDAELESSKAQHEAQVELAKFKEDSLNQRLKECRDRVTILRKYFECLASDELLVNKLKNEVNLYNNEFWLKLKPIMEKHRSVLEQSNKLKEVHQKCLELQQKAQSYMAPAH